MLGLADDEDVLLETELYEATSSLGNFHQFDDKQQYLVNKEDCLVGLNDLRIFLLEQNTERACTIRRKLGEWKVLQKHLVPLFTHYRDDPDITVAVLQILVQLSSHTGTPAHRLRHLQYLQDYKEAFAHKDVFIVLMTMLVQAMDDEERPDDQVEDQLKQRDPKQVFKSLLSLLRNLASVPDPNVGDAGYTPSRRHMQMAYIRHFHEEGVFDFMLLFAETLGPDPPPEEVSALVDIIYHVCAHVDPEEMAQRCNDKHKTKLALLLERELSTLRLRAPQSTRHSRFGTAMENRLAMGGSTISSSVHQSSRVTKGRRMWNKEFHDPSGSEKKQNMFHDPFFIDLEEGSVQDHNQLNPHTRSISEAAADLGEPVLDGLRKFFSEFVNSTASSLVSSFRSIAAASGPEDRNFDRPRLMNLVAWILEFHRHKYLDTVSKAKKEKAPQPVIDVASIQGTIDLDMLQFVTARLRQYGKESHIHASHLVIVLRVLLQQIKTINVVMDSKDSETADLGSALTQNIIKDDVLAHLVWIMKNHKSSVHDPRVLSYAVEVLHNLTKLMGRITEKHGQKVEFQVERAHGLRMSRTATTAEQTISDLADARVVENLFNLLEKYKRHTAAMNSILVKLIYNIIKARPTNIVVFFELAYFVRIDRIVSDPLVWDKVHGKMYVEMINLLQYILRQFFKCAETNGCAFVELLFRKVRDNLKESLLESHTSEFAAILDNYEDEDYKNILDRMDAGETLGNLRSRQKALLEGNLPWTEEEDAVLRDRYPMYADHPLCAELLAAELPEDSHRNPRQVKKRLAELGLIATNRQGGRAEQGSDGNEGSRRREDKDSDIEDDESPQKKRKLIDDDDDATKKTNTVNQDETLEDDLERLLDAAMDSDIFTGAGMSVGDGNLNANPTTGQGSANGVVEPVAPSPPVNAGQTSHASQEELNLEDELEAMIDEEGGFGFGMTSHVAPTARSAQGATGDRAAPSAPDAAAHAMQGPMASSLAAGGLSSVPATTIDPPTSSISQISPHVAAHTSESVHSAQGLGIDRSGCERTDPVGVGQADGGMHEGSLGGQARANLSDEGRRPPVDEHAAATRVASGQAGADSDEEHAQFWAEAAAADSQMQRRCAAEPSGSQRPDVQLEDSFSQDPGSLELALERIIDDAATQPPP